MTTIHINSLADISEAARQFIGVMGKHNIFAFYGSMGAGKTTFIKALCQQLGVEDEVTSPTFAIVNEYEATDGPVYHFDFYRIKKIDEFFDMGGEEYFYSGNICLLEWPELIEEVLPDDAVRVEIEEKADGTRELRIKN